MCVQPHRPVMNWPLPFWPTNCFQNRSVLPSWRPHAYARIASSWCPWHRLRLSPSVIVVVEHIGPVGDGEIVLEAQAVGDVSGRGARHVRLRWRDLGPEPDLLHAE